MIFTILKTKTRLITVKSNWYCSAQLVPHLFPCSLTMTEVLPHNNVSANEDTEPTLWETLSKFLPIFYSR